MPAHLVVLPARFDDLDRARGRALRVFDPQADDGVGDRLLVHARELPAVQHGGLERQDGGQVLALQALDENVERLARILLRIEC